MPTLIRTHTRRLVQIGFLILTLMIGIQFQLFVIQLNGESDTVISRPPGVEAFLPISALISLKYWLATGIFNTVHPSALVLLLIILSVAFFLKKGFCSWVCPVGLGSEWLLSLRNRLPLHLPRMPVVADTLLRGVKYVILLFFIWAIFVLMDVPALKHFIYSPYNRMADIKMLHFFTHISALPLAVLSAILFLTFLFKGFWCRYLCPYGALLGFTSLFSPFKIRRNPSTCTGCGECTAACPSSIAVHLKKTVYSDECHACYKCVDSCPEKKTLEFSAGNRRLPISKPVYALALVMLFILGIGMAKDLNLWKNELTLREYRIRIARIDQPLYDCNRGRVAADDEGK